LSLAMHQRLGQHFRRAHQGSFAEHARAAQDFFRATLDELDSIGKCYVRLSQLQCSEEAFQQIIQAILPEPKKPRDFEHNPGLPFCLGKTGG
jgi:hypothetical protein